MRHLKQRDAAIALFLVDERMPGMTGTQFLIEALKLYPDARRVLLTAYADTETAITAINRIGLDHYLLKPWEPPEQRLYPVLDDLLADWMARARPPFDGIRVAGTTLSAASYAVKDFLSRNLIPYQWVDLDADASARELVASTPDGMSRLPVVMFPDGTSMVQPTPREMAEKIGMQTQAAAAVLRRGRRGRRPGGTGRGRLRRVRRAAHHAGRTRCHRRAGGHQLENRELSRLSEWHLRRGSGAPGDDTGETVRRRNRLGPGRDLHSPQRSVPAWSSCRTDRS